MTSIELKGGVKAGTKVTAVLDAVKFYNILKRVERSRESHNNLKEWAASSGAKYVRPDGTVDLAGRYRSNRMLYVEGKLSEFVSPQDIEEMKIAGDKSRDTSNKGMWHLINVAGIEEVAGPDVGRGTSPNYLYRLPMETKCIVTGDKFMVFPVVSKTPEQMKDLGLHSSNARLNYIKNEYTDVEATKKMKHLGIKVGKQQYGYGVKAGVPFVLPDKDTNEPLEDAFRVSTQDHIVRSGEPVTNEVAKGVTSTLSVEDLRKELEKTEEVDKNRRISIQKMVDLQKKEQTVYIDRKIELSTEAAEAKQNKIKTATLEELDAMTELKAATDKIFDKLVGEAMGTEAAMIEE